jgi:hypothetical protein
MLDGAVAFARGERDVVDGDVVLPVDEAFGSPDGRRDAPQRLRRSARDPRSPRRRERRTGAKTRPHRRRDPCGVSFLQRRGKVEVVR